MSENTNDNSWSKYLGENTQSTTTASTSTINILESSSLKIFVMSFECSICFKKIMEVRLIPCKHTSCLNCVPVQCSEDCRRSFLDTIDRPELYDKVLGGYELRCCDLAKVVPTKKRQYPEQD